MLKVRSHDASGRESANGINRERISWFRTMPEDDKNSINDTKSPLQSFGSHWNLPSLFDVLFGLCVTILGATIICQEHSTIWILAAVVLFRRIPSDTIGLRRSSIHSFRRSTNSTRRRDIPNARNQA